jgi:asparagine synthase (glutamine-hydrolysing)
LTTTSNNPVRIRLSSGKGFPWTAFSGNPNGFVRGYAFDPAGNFLEGRALWEYFISFKPGAELLNKLAETNGVFAFIIQQENNLFASVDRLRSFPLFYADDADGLIISDEAIRCTARPAKPLLPAQTAYLQAGHTLGSQTLYPCVSQMLAGELLTSGLGGIQVEGWYKHGSAIAPQEELNDPASQLEAVLDNSFSRLVASAKGRQLVIPLSGGYDSRCIAAMLHKLNYPDVLCFTYGRPGSFEVDVSGKVAAALGFPWHFVEYDLELLAAYLDPQADTYRQYASNGVSIAHEQDYFALLELKQNGIIRPDALFVPGFGGDVLAGSWYTHLLESGNSDLSTVGLSDYILNSQKFFSGRIQKGPADEAILKSIGEEIRNMNTVSEATFVNLLESWAVRNRMSKFLVNAVRVYEFFGHEWRLPFWDSEYMDFWYGLPLSLRKNKALYRSVLFEKLFEPRGIGIEAGNALSGIEKKNWFKDMRQFLPGPIRRAIRSGLIRKSVRDLNNQETLSRLLAARLPNGRALKRTHDLNYIMAEDYLLHLHMRNILG